MTEVRSEPWFDSRGDQPTITVFPLKQNKRPVGFAPWPQEKPKKLKRKGKKK